MNAQQSYKNEKPEFLFATLLDLRKQERTTIADIVVIVEEIDRRELYKDLEYDSMFAYLTEELGYSGGSATRRLQAARLFRRHPILYNKIKNGDLTLTQLTDSYAQINAKGLPVLKAIEKLSRNETRHMFKDRKGPRGMRLSDPIALPQFMSKIPHLKKYLRETCKDEWADTAIKYIEFLERRKEQLENEIRRLRSK